MSTPDASILREQLTPLASDKLEQLEVFASIASTNTHLLAQPAPGPGRYSAALADHQTAGRGRHSRHWISAPGAGICLSLAYTFASVPPQLPALTLAIGVGVVDALEHLGIGDVSLKWPNDIVARDGKLGGILTEAQSGAGDAVTVVTGIGLNVSLPEEFTLDVGDDGAQRPIDLRTLHAAMPSQEQLAAEIINSVLAVFDVFERSGFVDFVDEWQRYDWLRDKKVVVDAPDERVAGIAAGVDQDGALLVDGDGGRKRIISGTIVKTDRLR